MRKEIANLSYPFLWIILLIGFAGVGCQQQQQQQPPQETIDHSAHVSQGDLPPVDPKFTLYAEQVNQGVIAVDTMKGSGRREAKGTVGNANLLINYGSPGVRGRTIWNGLVSYDQVWSTGSHSATSVSFDQPLMIGGTRIEAGRYGIFTIPKSNGWTWIINKNWNQHLADNYTPTDDVVRVELPRETHPMTQRLTYEVESISATEGRMIMKWDSVRVALPFQLAN